MVEPGVSERIPHQEEGEAMAAEFVSAAAGVAVASAVDSGPVVPWRTLLGGSRANLQCLISAIARQR